jgi:hypothetical protein
MTPRHHDTAPCREMTRALWIRSCAHAWARTGLSSTDAIDAATWRPSDDLVFFVLLRVAGALERAERRALERNRP